VVWIVDVTYAYCWDDWLCGFMAMGLSVVIIFYTLCCLYSLDDSLFILLFYLMLFYYSCVIIIVILFIVVLIIILCVLWCLVSAVSFVCGLVDYIGC